MFLLSIGNNPISSPLLQGQACLDKPCSERFYIHNHINVNLFTPQCLQTCCVNRGVMFS